MVSGSPTLAVNGRHYEGRAFVLPLLPSEYRKSAELNVGPRWFIQQEKEPGRGSSQARPHDPHGLDRCREMR